MIAEPVLQLCRAVDAAGGRALLVGGWVRDYLRGEEKSDYDLEVYSLDAEMLLELLSRHGRVNTVGEAYTVYKIRLRHEGQGLVVDVSLPRRESKVGRGHKGFAVTGDPTMSYAEASRRRDFTINSMLYDPLTGEIIDPHGGRSDLERRVLRVVDPATFVEDSLRVLRAMQFAARLEFSIDPQTIELCRGIDLSDLPAERIWGEVEKWLLQAARPSIGLLAARDLGIISKLWPELEAVREFSPLARALDEARQSIDDLSYPKQVTVMLATLCRDFAQGPDSFLERLRIFTFGNYDVRRQVLALVEHRGLPKRWHAEEQPVTDGAFRRLALRVEPALLYRVERATSLGHGIGAEAEEWFVARARALGIEEKAPEPLLMGRHVLELGLSPGPRVGEITRAVYELQLDDRVTSLEDAIIAARKLI